MPCALIAAASSAFIGRKAAQTLYYAAQQADRIGLPLTVFVTINFALSECAVTECVDAFHRLRNQFFRKWLSRRMEHAPQPTDAHCFENTSHGIPIDTLDDERHNIHLHWAVHIPAALEHEFSLLLPVWLKNVTAGDAASNAVDIRPITDPDGVLLYMRKGVNPTYARLYCYGQISDQGIVYGRRSGTSRNLGPAARRRADGHLGIKRQLPRKASR